SRRSHIGRNNKVRIQSPSARHPVRTVAVGGLPTRRETVRQRLSALHGVGRETGTGADPVHARPAYRRTWIHGSLSALHYQRRLHGGRWTVSKIHRSGVRRSEGPGQRDNG